MTDHGGCHRGHNEDRRFAYPDLTDSSLDVPGYDIARGEYHGGNRKPNCRIKVQTQAVADISEVCGCSNLFAVQKTSSSDIAGQR